MAKVRFTADFDYRPTPGITIAYRASRRVLTVRRECAEQASVAGKAVWVDKESSKADNNG